MGKTVRKSKFTELKGLDRISAAVHEMHCLWREISKDDIGIDGEIEVLREKSDGEGFETTGSIVKVQARSGQSHIAWDRGTEYAVSVKKEDLDYWANHTYPVLFIHYHPIEDRLYCQEVKSYIKSARDVFRPPFLIRFDKTRDEFSDSYRPTVCEHARVSPPRVSFQHQERLFSNLLSVVEFPKAICCAVAPLATYDEVKSTLRGSAPPFCIDAGQLYTLGDLQDRTCPLREYCEEPVTDIPAEQWLADAQKHRNLVFLLNQLLGVHLRRCGLRYNRDFGRNYFPRENEVDTHFTRCWWSVRTQRNAPARTLVRYYEYGQAKFWRHLAAQFEFREIGDRWFLQIVPKYFFTEDGETPCSGELAGPYTTVLKAKEHNLQVLNHVLFWVDILSRRRDSISMELDGRVIMRIQKMPLCGIAGFAIPDDPATFEEKAPSPQLSLFTWDQDQPDGIIEEDDGDY